MSSDEFFALIGVFFAVSSIGFAIAWIRTRERAIRAETALAHYRPQKTLGSESRPIESLRILRRHSGPQLHLARQ